MQQQACRGGNSHIQLNVMQGCQRNGGWVGSTCVLQGGRNSQIASAETPPNVVKTGRLN